MQQEYVYYTITDANEIIIDEEFKRILPVLSEKELAATEKSILKYGCIEPLKLWDGILIDGHNRLGILMKHDLPVKTVNIELASREEALIWIIDFQITRRNLNPVQLSYYRGLHYHTEKKVQGSSNQFSNASKDISDESEKAQSGPQQPRQSTAERLGNHYNVSRNTIKRDAQVATAINSIGEKSPEIKTDILSGKTHITRKQLKELSAGTTEDVAAVIDEIKDGSFISRKPGTKAGHENDYDHDSQDTTDMQPWEKEFSKMTDEFRTILRDHAKADDTTSVKTALRQYISMLENLYSNI